MASIINLEENIEIDLYLKKNDMFDYSSERSDKENWIPFVLLIKLPDRNCMIGEDVKAAMTVFEIKKLICGFENILEHLECCECFSYKFCSSESYFELKLEVIPEDDVIEMEVWINVGSQTGGKIFGFDEGIRFVVDKRHLTDFCRNFKKNYIEIMF